MTNPTWTYQGRIFNNITDFPEDTYGFIYEVLHKPTGQKYIGKKVLRFERNKRLGKRALEALREERKAQGIGGRVPLKQKVITESDWKDYYGSHPTIKKLVGESKARAGRSPGTIQRCRRQGAGSIAVRRHGHPDETVRMIYL